MQYTNARSNSLCYYYAIKHRDLPKHEYFTDIPWVGNFPVISQTNVKLAFPASGHPVIVFAMTSINMKNNSKITPSPCKRKITDWICIFY